MGRRRSANVSLPEGVQAVTKPSGKTYYYYQPHRGTGRAGARIALGSDPTDPEFWTKISGKTVGGKPGTFSALILDYRGPPGKPGSPEWNKLTDASKRAYSFYLDRIEVMAGDRMVTSMTVTDVYRLRDDMQATPHAANGMLSMLRTLIKWSIPRGYRKDNPVTEVPKLETDDDGAHPWPEDGYCFVIGHAPIHLRRATFLGRATGQRPSDVVRMRPAHLGTDGITIRVGKLRQKEHFVPLTRAQMVEIRSWGVADLDPFVKSTRGKQMSAHSLGASWAQWRETVAAKPILGLDMTMHGLRATAVIDRQMGGTPDNAIADELCMSVQMVAHYCRFGDKAAKARASRDRRERRKNRFVNSVVRLKTS